MMRIQNNKMIKTLLVAAFSFYSLASNAANQQYTFDTNVYLAGSFDFDSVSGEFSNFDFDLTGLLLDGYAPSDTGTITAPVYQFNESNGQFTLETPVFAPDYSIGNFAFQYSFYDGQNFTNTPGNISFSAAATVAAIPEPQTYAMFLAGLGLLGFAKRRQQA